MEFPPHIICWFVGHGWHPPLPGLLDGGNPSKCVCFKDVDRATQPFPWHLCTDLYLSKTWKLPTWIPPSPFCSTLSPTVVAPDALEEGDKNAWSIPGPPIWEGIICLTVWMFLFLQLVSCPNRNGCVFQDCKTAFLGVNSQIGKEKKIIKNTSFLSFPLNGSFRSVAWGFSSLRYHTQFLSHTIFLLKNTFSSYPSKCCSVESTKAKAYCLPRNICLSR